MKRYIPSIKISYTFPLFVVLILISGRYKLYFIFFLLCFIHELGHIIVALMFKCPCKGITVLPFGINASISNKDRLKSYQECLIYIAGPMMYFVNILLIDYLFKIGFLSYIGYIRANESNLLILIFNILPILPLDGGNIVKTILTRFFRIKIANRVSLVVSLIMLLFLIIATSSSPQYVIYSFLIFEQVHIYLIEKREYINLLINRDSKNYEVRVHDKVDLYRDYNNFYINEDGIDNEEGLCKRIIANSIKNNN